MAELLIIQYINLIFQNGGNRNAQSVLEFLQRHKGDEDFQKVAQGLSEIFDLHKQANP